MQLEFEYPKVDSHPKDWIKTTLGTHLAVPIRNGYSPVCPAEETGVWTLSLAAVTQDGFCPNGAKPAPTNDSKIYDYVLNNNDILVSRSNTPERVGLAGIYKGIPENCIYPDLMMRVRLKGTLLADYLLLQLLSSSGRKYFSQAARGSSGSMVKIDRALLEAFPLLLPPLKEQKAIAKALSDVDALITSLDQLIAKKRYIKQGAMQQLLTGKTRLPGFDKSGGKFKQTEVGMIPDDWEPEYIENFAFITTGGKNTQDRVHDGLYPFFVRSQKVERINSYSFEGEAVLTAGDGVGTGKVFHYINGKFDVHQRVYRITDFREDTNGYFFYLYFSNHFYNRIMQMTAKSSVDSVRMDMIAKMSVPLPPSKAEQDAISEVLSDMDAEITALEARRDKTKLLKQGMMQELLTGRTRLV